jgi:hypothetical protein
MYRDTFVQITCIHMYCDTFVQITCIHMYCDTFVQITCIRMYRDTFVQITCIRMYRDTCVVQMQTSLSKVSILLFRVCPCVDVTVCTAMEDGQYMPKHVVGVSHIVVHL